MGDPLTPSQVIALFVISSALLAPLFLPTLGPSPAPAARLSQTHGARPAATAAGISGSWKDLTSTYPSPPAARAYGGMVYDAASGYDVLFGGENGAQVDGDTWNLSTAHGWNEISSSSSVTARADPSFAYDSSSSEAVLYGGCEGLTGCPAGDTWVFSGGSWAQNTLGTAPPALLSATMSDDPPAGGLLLFGGCTSFAVLSGTCNTYVAGTYSFTASAGWSSVSSTQSPSARSSAGMAYDPVGGYVLLFGGYTGSSTLGDTWTFQGGQWKNITSSLSLSPPPRSAAAMFWDPALQSIILFGGNGASNDIGDTWAFHGGQWSEISASGGPSSRDGAMFAPPMGSGPAILFGGESNGTYESDTWGFEPTFSVSASGTPTAIDSGQSVAFTSLASGGQPPFSYSWSFGDNTTSPQANVSHTYSVTKATVLTATVTATDQTGATASASVHVNVTLLPSAQAAAAPRNALVGGNVSFWANVSGGTPPLKFAWNFGDSATSLLADPVHSYLGPGSYAARVVVTDGTGATSTASVNVTVSSPPGSFSVLFSASPPGGQAPVAVTFQSTVSNGTLPYAYTWTFGDGSPVSHAADPVHQFNASNDYRVRLNVSDGSGQSRNYSHSLLVTAPLLVVTAAATPTQGYAPLRVDFQGTVTGGQAPYNFTWDLGPGNTSAGQNATFQFNNSAVYNVTLKVTDAPGDGQFAEAWVLVNVTQRPVLTARLLPWGCVVAGVPTLFSANVSGGLGPYALRWDFGDHSSPVTTSATSTNHTYSANGTYRLNLTATDALGENISVVGTVNVVSAGGCSSSHSAQPTTLGPLQWALLLAPSGFLAVLAIATTLRRDRRPPDPPVGP